MSRSNRDLAARVASLPNSVLRTTLRLVGPEARLVCRGWMEVYGPMTGGVYVSNKDDIRAFVPASRPAAFAEVTSLVVAASSKTTPLTPELLSALPPAFPSLSSLALHSFVKQSPLSALQPLAPQLTSLTMRLGALSSATAISSTFPALRALSLNPMPPHNPRAKALTLPATLKALAKHLPHLHSFIWGNASAPNSTHPRSRRHLTPPTPAPAVIRPLADSFPRLTTLILNATCLDAWDPPTTALLATAFPHLSALGLLLSDPDDSVMAALAQRTALTHLSLNCHELPCASLSTLRQLHSLRVAHNGRRCIDPIPSMETLSQCATGLVQLAIETNSITMGYNFVDALASLAPTLQHLSLEAVFVSMQALQGLSKLTKLESLRMRHWDDGGPDDDDSDDERHWDDFDREGPVCGAIAAGLKRLQVLEIGWRDWEGMELFATSLAEHIFWYAPVWSLRLEQCGELHHMEDCLGRASSLRRLSLTLEGPGEVVPMVELLARVESGVRYLALVVADADSDDEADDEEADDEEADDEEADDDEADDEAAAEAKVVALPPLLRVLVVQGWRGVSGQDRAALRRAAAQQGCVIRRRAVHTWYDSACGCEEGAAPECAPGREMQRAWWNAQG